MTVEGDVLIQSPLAGTVIDHDISHGVTTEGVLAMPYQGLTTAEAHVTHNHVMGIHLE